MKKITAFILLVCLFFTVLGYHFVFRYRIWEAKSQMKSLLRNSGNSKEIIEFKFSENEAADLEWENNHEFYYNGEMFDVVQQVHVQDGIVIQCISDKTETVLIRQYLETNQQNHSGNQPLTALIQLAASLFLPPSDQFPVLPDIFVHRNFKIYSDPLSSIFFPLLTPPPRYC